MTISTSSLRAHLLTSLLTLPNPHDLGLTILVSEPKKTTSIFPHTPIPPKCLQQDFLVVLSSSLAEGEPSSDSSTDLPSSSQPAGSHNPPKQVLVSAISANLYTFPSSINTSSSILYISKIDSSGYSPSALPLTRLLIVSFLNYFLIQLNNVRIQLFARSQNQYLFANSSNSGKKKVLSGAGLCRWWKNVYEESVISYIKSRSERSSVSISSEGNEKEEGGTAEGIRLNYLLPGYEQVESINLLGKGKDLPEGLKWEYKPPFNTPLSSSSSSTSKNLPPSLATLIPSLPDDPKTRFLEELVTDHFQQHQSTNPLKRQIQRSSAPSTTDPAQNGSSATTTRKTKKELDMEEELSQRQASHLALSKIDRNEFWERIGFRQECAGDVTGFFTLEMSRNEGKTSRGKDVARDNGQEATTENGSNTTGPAHTVETVNTITSLDPESKPVADSSCTTEEGKKEIPIPTTTPPASDAPILSTKEPLPLLRIEIINRLLTALTNLDFANLTLAIEGSEIWLKQVRSIVRGEIGEEGCDGCSGVIPRKEGLSENENGGGLVRKDRVEEKVTMLMPRKKKKVN
ncbi:hypothetical protein I302_102243 [Kwoniella bestiolae CBS 10118]|uniref:histone acetyltransferase n=1 Tax=Kwoniella bestiolae CBS 10118 TaxID=1296100 RepID=A0A1B9GEI2_9TREE|nr:hypothetical protein I302_00932 [Kwoniella bestiolae CBS 10118]OCF29427.1 hypothetical protein I302_00932 [Kwoniella bestiolae CBS 10118]